MNKDKNIWFVNKTYGWGWVPSTWQGWSVIFLYFVFLIWNFLRLDAVSHSNSDTIRPFIIQTFLATAVLLWIAYKKGEKPGWHWGKRKN